MGDKYKTEYKDGGFLGVTPIREYVVDQESGERVGELLRWDYQKAGDVIASGEWEPYDDDEDD